MPAEDRFQLGGESPQHLVAGARGTNTGSNVDSLTNNTTCGFQKVAVAYHPPSSGAAEGVVGADANPPRRCASLRVAWTISTTTSWPHKLVHVPSTGTNNVDAMDLIVVDLEATCWDTSRPRSQMEIIEIGAVRLDANRWRSRRASRRTSQGGPARPMTRHALGPRGRSTYSE